MKAQDGYFLEINNDDGLGLIFKVEEKLHEEISDYQKIEIYSTNKFGNIMTIDGYTMLTSRDNFLYHEMISHPAIMTHNNPKNIAIIGGGDCGTLKEVLKHIEVEQATQIEIDEKVTTLSQKYFPELCTSNNDPRATLIFDDGIKWMKERNENSLDIVLVDSTDPIGPAKGLFNREFYKTCANALNTDGILVQQSESPILQQDLIKEIVSEMQAAGFTSIKTIFFPQPCYPSGWWSVTLATRDANLEKFRSSNIDTKYYNSEIHKASLSSPNFFRKMMDI